MSNLTYTDEQIKRIFELRDEHDLTWEDVTEYYNEEFEDTKTLNAIRKAYKRFQDYELSNQTIVKSITKAERNAKSKALVVKENKALVDYITARESVEVEIKELFRSVKFTKPKIVKIKKDRKKRNMTVECLLSDLHYGKLSKTFNGDVARERMRKLAEVTVRDITRYRKNYNIDRIVIGMLGDMIENATFHGMESMRACEMGNAEQVRLAIESLYEDYLVPLSTLGVPLDIKCIFGNHGRMETHQTYQSPGEEAFSWIIYHTLDMLCKKSGIKATFEIPTGAYLIYDVYGSNVLFEHGNFIKGNTKKAFETHLAKRSTQFGQLIDFMRIGHYHEIDNYKRGRIIVNGSLCGQDDYSDINGYKTEAAQVINYYVENESRPNPFYHSFPVYLDEEIE